MVDIIETDISPNVYDDEHYAEHPGEIDEFGGPEPLQQTPTPVDDDDDNTRYSAKVRRKFAKMTARHAEEMNAVYARQVALEHDLQEIRKNLETTQHTQKEFSTNEKLAELKTAKIAALDVGDHAEVLRLDDEILELRLSANKTPPQPEFRPQAPQPPAQQPSALQSTPPTALQEWEAKNQWLYDPKFAARKKMTNEIFEKMQTKDGWDPEEPETYVELSKQLAKKLEEQNSQRLPPSNVVDRGQLRGNVTNIEDLPLSPLDKKAMEGFGLDPNDIKTRILWKQNRGAAHG